ncbi:MAG: STAS domain protein [Methanoregulaceae archaeon PtaB.Bin108]|nr:MAG: STAS domain protein [Methanoregulaceae archaeon PtaB.Bin108]
MQVSSTRQDGILVLSMDGRLDSLGAIDLGDSFERHLEETDRTAVFDMEHVPYLSSAGIRVIISAEKTLKGRRGKLHLSGVQPYPLSVLEMTGFSTLLSLHPSCRDAVLAAHATAARAAEEGEHYPRIWHAKRAEFTVIRTGTDRNTLEIFGTPHEGGTGDSAEGLAIQVNIPSTSSSMGWGAPGRQTGHAKIPEGDFLSLGPVAAWLPPESHDILDYLIIDTKQASIPVTASFLIVSSGSPQFTVKVRSEEEQGIAFSDLIEALQDFARNSTPSYRGILSLTFCGESSRVSLIDTSQPAGLPDPAHASASRERSMAGCAIVADPAYQSGGWDSTILHTLAGDVQVPRGYSPRIMCLMFPTIQEPESSDPCETVSYVLSSGVPAVLRHLSTATTIKRATFHLSIILDVRQNRGTEIVIEGEVRGWNPDYERIVRDVHHECAEIHLHPLSGGFSGSLVFRDDAYDRQGRREMPFVLKLDRWKNIKAEIDGYEGHVKRYIQNNATQIIETGRSGEYGGILYTFVGIQGSQGRISSLEEYYLNHQTGEVLTVFDTLFRKVLRAWYGQPRLKDLPLYRVYADIFNYGAVKEWAKSRYGISPDEEFFELPYGLGRSKNPLYFMDHVLPQRLPSLWNVYEGSVHGDLNMKNVLMDEEKNMWLIDFAMTGHSHILRDIAKLECVLKFEMIPILSEDRLAKLASLEQVFLKPDRFGEIPIIPGYITDSDIQKAFSVIQQLRRYADTITLLDEDIRQYYLALLYYTLCVPAYVSVNEYMKEYAWISSSLLCNTLG